MIASQLPLKWLRRGAIWIIGITVIFLVVVLLVADPDAPRRALFGGRVQPSELAKLAIIIYLAVWMESKGDRLSEWGYGFVPLMFIVGITTALIIIQPDLSAAITVGLVLFVDAGYHIMGL